MVSLKTFHYVTFLLFSIKRSCFFTEAFYLPSRAGKSVLIFRNNKFWVNNQYRDKLNWACRDKDIRGCLCRVQTSLEGRFIKVKGFHNHRPNFTPENFQAPIVSEKKLNKWNSAIQCSEGWKVSS